jgi:hypothetical protein
MLYDLIEYRRNSWFYIYLYLPMKREYIFKIEKIAMFIAGTKAKLEDRRQRRLYRATSANHRQEVIGTDYSWFVYILIRSRIFYICPIFAFLGVVL